MKRGLLKIVLMIILGGGFYAGWTFRDQLLGFYQDHLIGQKNPRAELVPDPERYEQLKFELNAKRQSLSGRYLKASTAAEMAAIHQEARRTLEETLPDMMRCWLGTPWDFNGTSSTPGEGKIACGYFVSTIMRDAGFKVQRIKLAQQASQNIIKTFVPRNEMHIRTQLGYDDFLKQVSSRGPGIRIVGLDRHVAFLVISENGEVRFIHSSGAAPKCVVDEDRDHADVLKRSRYRVTGNITGNDQVIHKWLTGDLWPTST